MNLISEIGIMEVGIEIIVFLLLMFVFGYIIKRFDLKNYRIFNPREYFPQEEIHSLNQLSYLIMMGLLFIIILYSLVFIYTDVIYLVILDIVISLYLAIKLDKSSIKNIILLLLLIPYGSLNYFIFGSTLVGIMDLIHIPVFIYFIKVYYDKFMEYTSSNGLGITIILLFTIIFISFLLTQVFESVNPLDSIVMVSNAFTSNGYTVLGKTVPGKMNSVILVWGGYLLSGVGTATLTSGILINHYRKRLDKMDKKLDNLEELIKQSNRE